MKTRYELSAIARPKTSAGMSKSEYQQWRYARKALGMKIPLQKRGRKSIIPLDPKERKEYIRRYSHDYYKRVTLARKRETEKSCRREGGEHFDARGSPFVVRRGGKTFRVHEDMKNSRGSINVPDRKVV